MPELKDTVKSMGIFGGSLLEYGSSNFNISPVSPRTIEENKNAHQRV
jgi:hypothetical protein